jgi:hypothetical protein
MNLNYNNVIKDGYENVKIDRLANSGIRVPITRQNKS